MKYFEAILRAALLEDDEELLPEKEKKILTVKKKLGVKEPSPDLADEVNQEYYTNDR